jgi:maltose O-acetyltransferase
MAPRVHVLAHDASTCAIVGHAKIGRVNIGNNVFIGAESIVLPNVNIGDNVVIGAGSVVTKDIPPNVLAFGNPCRVIKSI